MVRLIHPVSGPASVALLALCVLLSGAPYLGLLIVSGVRMDPELTLDSRFSSLASALSLTSHFYLSTTPQELIFIPIHCLHFWDVFLRFFLSQCPPPLTFSASDFVFILCHISIVVPVLSGCLCSPCCFSILCDPPLYSFSALSRFCILHLSLFSLVVNSNAIRFLC